jgi:hypothetical protein
MDIFITLLTDFLLGIVATLVFEQILKRNKKLRNRYYRHHQLFFGYHVHHSTYGLVAVVASIILFFVGRSMSSVFWFMFGIGIIFEHTISDGRFIFIEKAKK